MDKSPNNRPKAVVFDLGKVLVEFDFRLAVDRIQTRCRLSPAALHELIDQSPLLFRYETGHLSTEGFFHEVKSAAGFSGTLEEFKGMFGEIFTEIPPMVDLHRQLAAAGVPTYIFSNTNPIAVESVRRSFPFFEGFDGYIFSYEVGSMKPDRKIYEALEGLSGFRGSDLLYLDDRSENVEAGAARGWQVIHHQFPQTTRTLIQQTGLLEELPETEP
jgi:FMN phosphatase YigB (HAD superfamily)